MKRRVQGPAHRSGLAVAPSPFLLQGIQTLPRTKQPARARPITAVIAGRKRFFGVRFPSATLRSPAPGR